LAASRKSSIEDVAAHLTIATGRPVHFEYTREEEFIAARSRHPMRIRMKTGVKNDGYDYSQLPWLS
jgi:putative selenate reductase molybdopterin-binding subunit